MLRFATFIAVLLTSVIAYDIQADTNLPLHKNSKREAKKITKPDKKADKTAVAEKEKKQKPQKEKDAFAKRKKIDKKDSKISGILKADKRYITNFVSNANAPKNAIVKNGSEPSDDDWHILQKTWRYSRLQSNLYGNPQYISEKNKKNFEGRYDPGAELTVKLKQSKKNLDDNGVVKKIENELKVDEKRLQEMLKTNPQHLMRQNPKFMSSKNKGMNENR
jgi:hypothetical protein